MAFTQQNMQDNVWRRVALRVKPLAGRFHPMSRQLEGMLLTHWLYVQPTEPVETRNPAVAGMADRTAP